jgi:ferrochelatase
VRRAVILFNLGGPDRPEAVEPFLRNLFSDPAIISLPAALRLPLAWLIAKRRGPIAREIYAKIGGRSPILEETEAQARALEGVLAETRAFIAMRCWKPFAEETARAVKDWAPDRIVLLPLYPQFSTTTTASAFADWHRAARRAGLEVPTTQICCYPTEDGFISALADLTQQTMAERRPEFSYRVLLSAHGLPERIIAKGDPYRWQIENSAARLIERLGITDWAVCYQSRVGPLKWIEPATDAEIRRAGRDGKGVIIVPLAFVSEHSETLVELDIEYARLARDAGVPHYLRVPTVGTHPAFIGGLARLVERDGAERLCPAACTACGYGA